MAVRKDITLLDLYRKDKKKFDVDKVRNKYNEWIDHFITITKSGLMPDSIKDPEKRKQYLQSIRLGGLDSKRRTACKAIIEHPDFFKYFGASEECEAVGILGTGGNPLNEDAFSEEKLDELLDIHCHTWKIKKKEEAVEELKLKNMNAKERTKRYVGLTKNLGIRKFYICNLVGELGIDTADELAGYLTQYGFEIEHCIQKPEEIKEGTEFAIILIHSKKAYAEMKRINKNVKDAYTGADFSVQHMVIPYLEDEKRQKTKGKKKKKSATNEEESSRNVDQNVFLKLLAEAIIKTDLLNETLSLVDMTEFIGNSEDSEMTVQWITRKKRNNKKKTSEATQNASESPSDSEIAQEIGTNTAGKEKPNFWCPQITVLSDGTIDRYFSFDDETSDLKKEGFKNLREEEEKRGRMMQCVVGINGNKYVVSRTEEVFLPKEGLDDQLVKEEVAVCSVSDFQNYLKKFYKQTHCDDYYNAVLKKLDTFLSTQNKSDCNKGDLRSLCKNSKCKEDEKAMLKFLHANGIDTVSHKKDKETKKINGLDAFDYVHFRIVEEPVSDLNPNIKEPVLQYVVGELALNQSLTRALHVYTMRYVPDGDDIDKQVSADTKKAQMFIIFRMTDVFFVRENEFTVVPFICKYAREWERVIWSDHFEEEGNQEQENDTEDETIDLSNEPDEDGESVF